jgi:glycerol-3-phosphate acyltransferase PlsY
MVATGGGVIFAVCTWAALAVGGIWLATFLLSRYTSLASVVSAIALPVMTVVLGYPWPVIAFASLAGAAIVFLHRANLRRLRAGTENRFRGLRRPARA